MIPFLDLQSINQPYLALFQEAIATTIHKNNYISGAAVDQFEKEFATYCGTQYCLGTSNGLDALTIILKGYIYGGKLQEGDEIIVPANTFIASILAIINAGLTPVLVEPDYLTFNSSPNEIRKHIGHKTKAIMIVHLYGQLASVIAMKTIAQEHQLLIIEDAAQAHGAIENGIKAGNWGDAAAFSFYPGKNLGALGDAGAIVTNDADLQHICQQLINYGSAEKYKHNIVGYNARLDALQALFLSIKLPYLDANNQKRREIAQRYLKEIKNTKIRLPYYDETEKHVFHLFVVKVADRNHFQQYLYQHNIETLVHYPIAPHRQKALAHLAHLSLPITEQLHQEIVSLPLYPTLSTNHIQHIIQTLNAY